MTTLAIIGSGILGRSLIYTLAKEQKQFQKIVVFFSDNFAFPCTLHSTAIVAPRGLSEGKSPLGDMLMDGFRTFSEHVKRDRPDGVHEIRQYTGATRKLDAFKERYRQATPQKLFLKNEILIAVDDAYLIDPQTYGDWLIKDADFELINDFVIEVNDDEVKTVNGRTLKFDKIIFAGGNYNRFWKDLAPESRLKSSRPVHGSYYEFNGVNWPMGSFSLTLDGDNLIWNKKLNRVLIGSTSEETSHVLPFQRDLENIYSRLKDAVDLELPINGEIKTGLREKAQKREPYIVTSGNRILAGGLYKNGFSLSLELSKKISSNFL